MKLRKVRRVNMFSLMEIMIAVSIMAIMASIAGVMVFKELNKAKVRAARTQVKAFEQSALSYSLDNKKLPASLNDLLTNNSGSAKWQGPYISSRTIPTDPWGAEYIYAAKGNSVEIISCGPDGAQGTVDDISLSDVD